MTNNTTETAEPAKPEMQECKTCGGSGKIPREFTDEEFEAYLTDIYGTVKVCGYWMDSGRILHECDEIAFNCAKNDAEGNEDNNVECDECGGTGEVEEETAPAAPAAANPASAATGAD